MNLEKKKKTIYLYNEELRFLKKKNFSNTNNYASEIKKI